MVAIVVVVLEASLVGKDNSILDVYCKYALEGALDLRKWDQKILS